MPQQGIDLELYQDPGVFIRFLSYIRARGVKTSHLIKHISVARKLLDFLQSGSQGDNPIRAHTLKMDSWLNLLSRQLAAIAPVQSPDALPDHSNVKSWGLYKINLALQDIEADMLAHGHLTLSTALNVSEPLTTNYLIVISLNIFTVPLGPERHHYFPCLWDLFPPSEAILD